MTDPEMSVERQRIIAVAVLHAEITKLKRDNAELRKRIEELEKAHASDHERLRQLEYPHIHQPYAR